MNTNTAITFLGIRFRNPIVLASGILGVTAASLKRCADLGAGGVTMKSVSLQPRTGHHNPTMMGTDHYFLNAVGLSNPGVHEAVKEVYEFKKITRNKVPLIGSIFGGSIEEFLEVAHLLCAAPIDILEVNLSCPNVGDEFGCPLAYSAQIASDITRKIKKVTAKQGVPMVIKLSPNAWNIAQIAAACEQAGADAITAVNTVSGMAIDATLQAPVLANMVGGVSGAALKPIALKAVWDIFTTVKRIPIIATGGVLNGEDAIEMMLAGGTLVGVGSAVWWRGPEVFGAIVSEIIKYMKNKKIHSLSTLIGKAHHTL